MKYTRILSLIMALLPSAELKAQKPQSSFLLESVVEPGMTIAGRTLGKNVTMYGAAINDVDEIAFTACLDDRTAAAAVFTSSRIVAQQGDVFDGKTLMRIRLDSPVAINRAGQVMYDAYFGDTPEIAARGDYSGLGLFVDNHLALRLTTANENDPFTLTEDGQVLLKDETRAAPQAVSPAPPPKKPGLLDRVKINPLKLPKGPTIGLGPDPSRSQPAPPRNGARPMSPDSPLVLMRANGRGQILIPVNIPGQGFVLLLATPVVR